MNKQDHKTQDFLEKIDYLISRGVIKNQAEVVSTLNWNKSVMSSVKNGSLPVPQHIYNKFKEVYAEQLIKNPDLNSQDLKDKYITLLESSLMENKQMLEEVKASLRKMPLDMVDLTTKMIQIQSQLTQELRQGQKEMHKDLLSLKSALGTTGKKTSRGQKS
jgi:hypothetical protein